MAKATTAILLAAGEGSTDIFIYPGYKFNGVQKAEGNA